MLRLHAYSIEDAMSGVAFIDWSPWPAETSPIAPDFILRDSTWFASEFPPPPPPPLPPPSPPEQRGERPGEPPQRYSDFVFYNINSERVPDGNTLRMQRAYILEVAVRETPSGIPYAEGDERRPIREPRQKEPVTIWVVAESEDFRIDNPTQTLVLPPTGDSRKNAIFIITPRWVTPSNEHLGLIYVTIYYEFNLLEFAEIYAEVVGLYDDTAESRLGLKTPIFFRQRKLRDYRDFDAIRVRSASIYIKKSPGSYDFRFLFRNPAVKPDDKESDLVLPARVRLYATDLEDRVTDVRNIWKEIVLNDLFATGIEGTKSSFADQTARLARAGRNLWRALFLQETKGSMAAVADWLKDHAPEQNAIIQIHLDPEASDFVFPWALLYDRELPEKEYFPVDLEGFWGLRYRIEQPFPGRMVPLDEPTRSAQPLHIGFMLWDQFRNAQEQIKLMQVLVEESGGKLAVSVPPVTDAKACYELLKSGSSQILYFYSHGYARVRLDKAGNSADLGSSFVEIYEKLDKSDSRRESLKILYEAILQILNEPKRSYIQLTYGKLYLDELHEIRSIPGEPLVVLNMCESAQRSPLLSESFVHFFLDRGAAAVLGTECPMTVEFAHPFSEFFLDALLRGDEVGEALLRSRRKFLKMKNPLGLAYTLYGRDTLAYEPPCLEA